MESQQPHYILNDKTNKVFQLNDNKIIQKETLQEGNINQLFIFKYHDNIFTIHSLTNNQHILQAESQGEGSQISLGTNTANGKWKIISVERGRFIIKNRGCKKVVKGRKLFEYGDPNDETQIFKIIPYFSEEMKYVIHNISNDLVLTVNKNDLVVLNPLNSKDYQNQLFTINIKNDMTYISDCQSKVLCFANSEEIHAKKIEENHHHTWDIIQVSIGSYLIVSSYDKSALDAPTNRNQVIHSKDCRGRLNQQWYIYSEGEIKNMFSKEIDNFKDILILSSKDYSMITQTNFSVKAEDSLDDKNLKLFTWRLYKDGSIHSPSKVLYLSPGESNITLSTYPHKWNIINRPSDIKIIKGEGVEKSILSIVPFSLHSLYLHTNIDDYSGFYFVGISKQNDLLKKRITDHFGLLQMNPCLAGDIIFEIAKHIVDRCDKNSLKETCKFWNLVFPNSATITYRNLTYWEGGNYDDTECLLFEFTLPGQMHQLNTEITWVDQGWGNRKGCVYFFLNECGIIKEVIKPFGIAEHSKQTISRTLRFGKFITDSQKNDKLVVKYVVGGGGGHRLLIKKLILKIDYWPDY